MFHLRLFVLEKGRGDIETNQGAAPLGIAVLDQAVNQFCTGQNLGCVIEGQPSGDHIGQGAGRAVGREGDA